MKILTDEQIDSLKDGIDKMAESDEQFIFMLYKNKDGSDRVIQYANNADSDKLRHYLKEASDSALTLTTEGEDEGEGK